MSDKPFFLTQMIVITTMTLLALSASGCEVIGGIFKAGLWVGVILVLLVVGLIVWFVRGRRG